MPTADVFEVPAQWRPIATQARLVWMLAASAFIAPVVLFLLVVLAVAWQLIGFVVGAGLAVGSFALAWWLIGRRHRAWGYSVREDELLLRRGRIVRRLTIVPIGRMQLIDIQQGPLDRRLGVANLQLHTAAAASNAKVPLLVHEDAVRLRDELLSLGAGRRGGT